MASTVPTEVHCRPSPNLLLEYSIYQLSFWSRILLSPFLADVFLWRRLQVRCISPVSLVGQLPTLGLPVIPPLAQASALGTPAALRPSLVLRGWSDYFIAVSFLNLRAMPCLYLCFKPQSMAPGKRQTNPGVHVSSVNEWARSHLHWSLNLSSCAEIPRLSFHECK